MTKLRTILLTTLSLAFQLRYLAVFAVVLSPTVLFAQNPSPAVFDAIMTWCPAAPNQPVPFVIGTFSKCQDAEKAVTEVFYNRCASDPGATICSAYCPYTYQGTNPDAPVQFNNPGGACNGYGVARATCSGNVTPQYDSSRGWYCPTGTYDKPLNAGKPKDCQGRSEGNPCDPAIGNKFQTEVDYNGFGRFPLKFVRYYNSVGLSAPARMGAKWTHTYSRRLVYDPTRLNLVSADREDGKSFAFVLTNNVYVGNQNFAERLERTVDGWKLTNTDDELETYDNNGRLMSITSRVGLAQTLTYDTKGRLVRVTDPDGRTLTFGYDTSGRVQSVTAPGTLTFTYSYTTPQVYQAIDNLSRVTYPDTTSRRYHFENTSFPNHLTGITDENSVRFATFGYDTSGRVVSTEHAGGANKVTFVNSSGSPTRDVTVTRFVDSAQSASRTYSFNSIVGVASNTAIVGSACPTCGPAARTYDANGNVATSTDWNGNRTNYTYDLARNLEISRTEGLTSGGGTTPETRKISTQWHAAFRLLTGIAEPLRITTNVYDVDGTQCGARGALCSKSVQATSDPDGMQGFSATPVGAPRVWTYTYNANGQVLTVDGPRTDVSDVTTYTYYGNDDPDLGKRGNVATITNAAGHVIQITEYNPHGQPLTIIDANGLNTTLVYETRQRLRSRTVGGEPTTYDYDNAGQLTKLTLPDGSFLSYGYDDAHRLASITDNQGNRIAYTLDLAGNRVQEQIFDPANQLAQTRSRVYNSLNRLFQELGAAGQTSEYGYDNQGNVTSVKDPLNHTIGNQYDALNRLKQVTAPAPISAVTLYAYNGLDALTRVTDGRNLETTYAVDGVGNLTRQLSPDTGTTTNTYDDAGNLLTQDDAKSQRTAYAYDALNRVTLITFHDGSKQEYAYDLGANGIGRLSSITERDPANQVTNVIAYAYDPHGRVTSETRTVNGVQYTTGYGYDAAGRLFGLTYPSGRTVTYDFDSLGRVYAVNTTKDSTTQAVVSNVTYHPFGGVKSFTLGNGQTYTRSYDQDGRISSYTLGAAQYTIGYDAASRIESISQVGNPSNLNTYGYDALDRLTGATVPGTPFAYAYDEVGNRTSKTAGNATETLTYSPTSNRIATLQPASGPLRNFVFDANGSTTNDGVNTYTYDTRGRMVQATSVIGTTNYQVNALGQRIRKTNSQTDRVFHYDTRGRLIAETDPGGTLKREYVYLGDILIGVVQ